MMSSDLMSHVENHRQYPVMDSETGIISIDQGGEWGKLQFNTLCRQPRTEKLTLKLATSWGNRGV